MTSRPDDIVARTRAFIDAHVIPIENNFDGDIEAAGGEERRIEMQRKARAEHIFAPHVSPEFGGLGLGMADRAPVFEAAGHIVMARTSGEPDSPGGADRSRDQAVSDLRRPLEVHRRSLARRAVRRYGPEAA